MLHSLAVGKVQLRLANEAVGYSGADGGDREQVGSTSYFYYAPCVGQSETGLVHVWFGTGGRSRGGTLWTLRG